MLDDHEVNLITESELIKTTMIRDFLIDMLLTHEWSDKFQNVLIQTKWNTDMTGYAIDFSQVKIADYMWVKGYLKYSKDFDYKYDISVKGRKYLEKLQKGEKYDK